LHDYWLLHDAVVVSIDCSVRRALHLKTCAGLGLPIFCMFDFGDLDNKMTGSGAASVTDSDEQFVRAEPQTAGDETIDDRPDDHENSHVWWMETRTWPHWFQPSKAWAQALASLEAGMGALMGFTETTDDDGNPRWTCNCCAMNDRKLTGFCLVKHIQGKKHLDNHLTDQNSNQKEEILGVRWLLHQLLEDKNFFC
jgi:hypothetical protein